MQVDTNVKETKKVQFDIKRLFRKTTRKPGQLIGAQEFLGIEIAPYIQKVDDKRIPYVAVRGSDLLPRGISVLSGDSDLLPYVYGVLVDAQKSSGKTELREAPGLRKIFDYTKDATLLIRSLPTKYEFLSQHLRTLADKVTPPYADFLLEAEKFVNPDKNGHNTEMVYKKVVNELMIWADIRKIVPASPGEETAGCRGRLVLFPEYGSVGRSVIFRQPTSFKMVDPTPGTNKINHFAYMTPECPVFFSNRVSFGERSFAYWRGLITPENIRPLLALNLDLLFRIRIEQQKYLYVTAVIRAEAPDSQKEELNEITTMLQEHYGRKWERLKYDDMWQAFHCFVPGSAPLPSEWLYTGLNSNTYTAVLGAIPPTLEPVSNPNGTMIIGRVGHETLLDNARERPTQFITGASKISRKTGFTAFRAMCLVPFVYIPLAPAAFDTNQYYGETFSEIDMIEWNSEINKNFPRKYVDGEELLINKNQGDQKKRVIELFLPDARHIISARSQKERKTANMDKGEVSQLQEYLHDQDRQHAESVVQLIYETFYEYKKPVGRPITFKINGDRTLRLYNWYYHFVQTFASLHRDWYQMKSEHDLLIFDNVDALKELYGHGVDPYLGRLHESVAKNLAEEIDVLVNNGANNGILTWVIGHDIHDFDPFNPNIYNTFSLHIDMGYHNGEIAHVTDPKTGEPITDKLQVTLPPTFKDIYQRRENIGSPTFLKITMPEEVNIGRERNEKPQ